MKGVRFLLVSSIVLAFFLMFLFSVQKSFALSCSLTTYYNSGFVGTWSGANLTQNNACTRAADQCNAAGCEKCVLGGHIAPCTQDPLTLLWSCSCMVNGTNCPTTSSWTCPASQCDGCTYYGGGVSCSSTVGSCVYGTSYLSNTCGAGCVPSITPAPPPTCVAGTGSTNASCGGFAYYAIQPSSGLCCEYTYRCVSDTCTAACHNNSIDQSLCGGGISCPRCNASNTCENYTYTGGPTCPTTCNACPGGGGGGTCLNTKLKFNPKTG